MKLKTDILYRSTVRDAIHFQHDPVAITEFAITPVVVACQIASDHHSLQHILRNLFLLDSTYKITVSQHADAVAHTFQFFHIM